MEKKNARIIMEFIKDNPNKCILQIGKDLNFSYPTIISYIHKLIENGNLGSKRITPKKTQVYFIKNLNLNRKEYKGKKHIKIPSERLHNDR